ncbi:MULTISPECIES: molybdopterin molybdotransferase MoeA [Hyphobacterium]|uniref:Molybdopterin molybdenumtransferase n=1 Tax=Hyphobacterium vulgare TaxID=1736751 RepID=A0ABV6ZY80_9PROT
MISFDEAIARLTRVATPLGPETVPLSEASGRRLAADVSARLDSPRSAVSAMDGYAVRSADLRPDTPFAVIGESFPGRPFGKPVKAGECVRIFTGAPVPEGADRVVIQENAARDGERVSFSGSLDGPAHIRAAGSDFGKGDTLLTAGHRLNPRALVAAAAADAAKLDVFRRADVFVLATGDELKSPGEARLTSDGIPDSLSAALIAFIRDWGGVPVGQAKIADDPGILQAAARQALEHADVVLVTGGASVGEKDFARDMFGFANPKEVFSKAAIKPGKPVWLSQVGGGLVLGLPGNPTSAMVTARLFLAPLLTGLEGGDPAEALQWQESVLTGAIGRNGGRETFHRARLSGGTAEPLGTNDSGAQAVLAEADLLVRQAADHGGYTDGETVRTLDF